MIKAFFIVILVCLGADSIVCKKIPSLNDLQKIPASVKKNFVGWTSEINKIFISELGRVIDKSRDTCQNFKEKLEATVIDLNRCQDEIKVGSSTVCETVKAIVTKCSRPAKQLLNDCLPVEYKDLPLFIERILVSLIKQFCGITIEELTEFFNPCQFKKRPSSFESCKVLENLLPRSFPNSDQLCAIIKQLKICSYDIHSACCTNPITLNAFAKFHKTIEEDTESYCPNKTINEV